MQSIETGRSDIGVYRETGTGKPVRLVTIGSYGDETVKGLTASEAMDLAVALIKAAGVSVTDEPIKVTEPARAGAKIDGNCPVCGHWPYSGNHGPTGSCAATGGSLEPCGCRHQS